MSSNQPNELHSLDDAIQALDIEYKEKIKQNPLFDPNKTKLWTDKQKQYFCKVFYHLRGHFHDFLWLMGNFAPSLDAKNIFLKNIGEEFGENRHSHEQLYFDFANALQVDILQELITESHYTEFARTFNKGHIKWLLQHTWNQKLSAFAAYERLDNIDYPQLFGLADSFSLSKKALLFFEVHTKVEHYDAAKNLLSQIWTDEPESIIEGFTFIYSHQAKMWEDLFIAVEAMKQASVNNEEEGELLTA